jgi:hypothetical protein
MTLTPVETLRSARLAISAWLDAAKISPDPTAQFVSRAKALNAELKRAAALLGSATGTTAAPHDNWDAEAAQYRAALAALKSQLEHVEIILYMRATNLKRRCAKIDALRSWANLTRNIH